MFLKHLGLSNRWVSHWEVSAKKWKEILQLMRNNSVARSQVFAETKIDSFRHSSDSTVPLRGWGGLSGKMRFPKLDFHVLALKSSCLLMISGSTFPSCDVVSTSGMGFLTKAWTLVAACDEGLLYYSFRLCALTNCYLALTFNFSTR